MTILGLILLFTSVAFARSNSVNKAYNEGVKLLNARDCNSAVRYFDDALTGDPDFAEAYYARGACKYTLQSFSSALSDLNSAVRLNPNNLPARALRGAVHYESDRWDDAVADYDYVLTRDPSDAQALLGRAIIRLKREQLPGAARDFRSFLQQRPDDPMAPEIKKVLAAISPEGGAPARAAHSSGGGAPRRTASKVDVDKLVAGLMGSPMADSYQEKAMRAENAQAVGDIESIPGTRQTAPKDR